MRPEKLAVIMADAIRSAVAPLHREIVELRGVVVALETRDARHSALIADLQKSNVETRSAVLTLESFHPVKDYVDLRESDPRH